MAEQAQVLRDLGSGWQECLDTQGVFYFNSVTGQSQDTLPQEFAKVEPVYQQEVQPEAPYAVQGVQGVQGQPAGPEEATVKMQLGVWSICEDNQGEFYHNATTGQTFDQPPPELLELYEQSQGGPAVDAQPAPVYHQAAAPVCQAAAPAYQASAPAYEASAPVGMSKEKPVEQEEATVKMTVGVWSVCEDQQGEFYHNGTTGQTFDNPPQELLGLLQQSQGSAPVVTQAAPVHQAQTTPVYQTKAVAQPVTAYQASTAPRAPVYQTTAVAQQPRVYQAPMVAHTAPVFQTSAVPHTTPAYQAATTHAAPVYQPPAVAHAAPKYQAQTVAPTTVYQSPQVAPTAAPSPSSVSPYPVPVHQSVHHQSPRMYQGSATKVTASPCTQAVPQGSPYQPRIQPAAQPAPVYQSVTSPGQAVQVSPYVSR